MQRLNVLAQATVIVLLQPTLATRITIYQYVNVVPIQTSRFATQEEIVKMLRDNQLVHVLHLVIVWMKLLTHVIQEPVQQAVDAALIQIQTFVILGGFVSILQCTLNSLHVPVWMPQIAWKILTPVIHLRYLQPVHVVSMDMFPVRMIENV